MKHDRGKPDRGDGDPDPAADPAGADRDPAGAPVGADPDPAAGSGARRGLTPSRRLMPGTSGYFWALFALGLAAASIGPSLPRLAEDRGVSLGAVSIVFAAYRAGFILGSLGGGALLDRLRGHALMAGTLLVMAGSLAVIPVLPGLAFLVIGFLLVGTAAGMVETGGNTLLVWSYGARVGPYMSGLHFAFGIGAILSPLFIGQAIALTGGIEGGFLLSGALILPGALLFFRAPSPSSPDTQSAEHGPSRVLPTALIAVFLLLYVAAEAGFGGWIYTFAVRLGLAEPAQAGALTSLFWGALTVGRLILVPVSTRVPPGRLLAVSVLGSIVFLGVLSLPAGSRSAELVWVASAGTGLSMAAVFPSTMSFAGRHMRVTGSVSRWFFVGAGVGGMLVPWALGNLVETAGAASVMPALSAIVVAMAIVLSALLVVVRRR